MTDKDNVSMATVQMKPDYAASEVYSTASEAPPAYKRQSNSVKIAKITAFTVIAASFILGTFILASSYLQAKAACDQVEAFDSVLQKELMLEALQQVNKELPRAEALLGKENADDIDLQNLDKQETVKKVDVKKQQATQPIAEEESNSNDNSYSDSEETDELQKYPGKVPLELDLSDLAAALLQNNKKSRMNCVVERKHAEEIVNSPSKTVALPFGMNLTTDPKKARITGERISIYCEGGNENKDQEGRNLFKNNREEDDDTDEDAEPIRPMFIPYQRVPIPFGPIPQQFPLTHMPQRMMPPMQPHQPQQQQQPPMIRQLPPPFQQLPMRPPMPPQIMQAPRPEPQAHMMEPQHQTVRIHVQQVPFREIHVADDVPVQIPAQHQELPHFQIQRLPLDLALQRAGITPEDLRNIQRMAEDRITDELRRLAADETAESAENNSNSNEEDDDSQGSVMTVSDEQQEQSQQPQQQQQQQQLPQQLPQQPQQLPMRQPELPIEHSVPQQPPQRLILQQLPEQPRDTMSPPMPDQPQQMLYGRGAFGRSLAQPVRIPVPMMQAQADMSQEIPASSAPTASVPSAAASSQQQEPERPHFHLLSVVQPRSV